MALFEPFAQSIESGDLEAAREDLATGTAAGEIEKLTRNRFVQAQERRLARELRVQQDREGFGLSAPAERFEEIDTRLQELGGTDSAAAQPRSRPC